MAYYSIENSGDCCYEGTSVLINKLGIRDEEELAEVESIITTTKITMLLSRRYDGEFSAEHYCDLHREIMGDLYDWAGTVRSVDLSKKGTRFHAADGLERDMRLLFQYLNEQNCFLGLGHDEYAERIAEFYSDINMLHPFREGNGRAQRVLVTQLVERAGRNLDFSSCDKDLLMIATIHAAHGVSDHLINFFADMIE